MTGHLPSPSYFPPVAQQANPDPEGKCPPALKMNHQLSGRLSADSAGLLYLSSLTSKRLFD